MEVKLQTDKPTDQQTDRPGYRDVSLPTRTEEFRGSELTRKYLEYSLKRYMYYRTTACHIFYNIGIYFSEIMLIYSDNIN